MIESYPGGELTLFAAARHWKRYVASMLAPFIGERVLEVGAGLGANIPYLHHARVRDWLCLEPDGAMARGIAARIAAGDLPATCRVIAAGTEALRDARFDSILYLDVLEHIADDRAEMARAAGLLGAGGALIVLAPAHPFLFSAFDAAIGHHRRYTKAGLLAAAPAGARLRLCRMLEFGGVLRLARQPAAAQVGGAERARDRAVGSRHGAAVARTRSAVRLSLRQKRARGVAGLTQ